MKRRLFYWKIYQDDVMPMVLVYTASRNSKYLQRNKFWHNPLTRPQIFYGRWLISEGLDLQLYMQYYLWNRATMFSCPEAALYDIVTKGI